MNKEDIIKFIDGIPFYRYEYADFLYQKLEEKDKEIEDYKSRIDKAVEYIKGWQSFPHTNGSTHNELRNLLNILEGDDKE